MASLKSGDSITSDDIAEPGEYLADEVERFCAVYFTPKQRQSAMDHQAMNAALDPAVARFTVRQKDNEDEAELWRGKVQAFRNLYGFLSQVIPYQDSDLERLYVFLRHLATKLPRRKSGPAYQFDDEVRLEYRLQKISEGSISLREGDARAARWPHRSRQRSPAAAAGAALAAHRRRERALRDGFQPGRSTLLRSDCRSGNDRRGSATGGRGESG